LHLGRRPNSSSGASDSLEEKDILESFQRRLAITSHGCHRRRRRRQNLTGKIENEHGCQLFVVVVAFISIIIVLKTNNERF
jgi:hypothetical protein